MKQKLKWELETVQYRQGIDPLTKHPNIYKDWNGHHLVKIKSSSFTSAKRKATNTAKKQEGCRSMDFKRSNWETYAYIDNYAQRVTPRDHTGMFYIIYLRPIGFKLKHQPELQDTND